MLYSFDKLARQVLAELESDSVDLSKLWSNKKKQTQESRDATIDASTRLAYLRNRVQVLQDEVTKLKASQSSEGANSQSPPKGAPVATQNAFASAHLVSPGANGIRIDAQTARNAVIMSEIIGSPISKRSRRR